MTHKQFDFEAIAQSALARSQELVQEWFPAGKKCGNEWKVGGLDGSSGNSLSINLNSGVWKDFASDEGGSNLITLLAAKDGIKNLEAGKRIADRLGVANSSPQPLQTQQKEEWVPLVSGPHDGFPTDSELNHFKFGTPSVVYEYWDTQHTLHGLVCRWDLDGKKEILPISYCEKNGQFGWRWKSFAKPRPIFRKLELFGSPDSRVILVEGEKACLAAQRLFPKAIVVTWPGGSKAVKYVDWSPLAEREVYLWPDADDPGRKAMLEIAEILLSASASVFLIDPPDGVSDGWDLADAETDSTPRETLVQCLKSAKKLVHQAEEEPPDGAVSGDDAEQHEHKQEEELNDRVHPDVDFPDEALEPFKILGHADGVYFYLRKSTQTIHSLTPGQHSKLELIALAPAHYWEQNYPTKGGADWFAAANSLIQRASMIDFSPNNIRGRGAWLDEDRVVFHAGNTLYVERKEIPLDGFSSSFTYKKGTKLQADIVDSIPSKEAVRLVDLLGCCQFRNSLDHKLMAGWLALAPICGALEWRPHLWLTGPSGSGKSWILSQIVRPLLGNCAVYFQSVSTSAGIRQSLGCDALPVVFDEAEIEREADQRRMQEIIILARQASRETDGRIVKGTAGGSALTWHIRSTFLFASIGLGATQRADLSRITCIDLLPENQRGEDRFKEALAIQKETVRQASWTSAFRARSVELAAVIAANSEQFKNAVLDHLGNQRDADQFGALLAGAYSLYSKNVITPEQAADWCSQQDWSAFQSNEQEKDENKCLTHLLESIVICTPEAGSVKRITIMELLQKCLEANQFSDEFLLYKQTLERHGIGFRKEGFDVANSHEELAKIYRNTPFVGKWGEMLRRLPGTKRLESTKILDLSKRAVRIPSAYITHDW